MMRTKSAILFAALSGALAGPPATFWGQASAQDAYFTEDNASGVFTPRIDAGVVLRDADAGDTLLFDLDAELEYETFSHAGRRWGWVLGGRIERDTARRGWGGLAGDCPAGAADCASVEAGGAPAPVTGPVSGFYTAGPADRDQTRAVLDAAYLYTDTGWGELRLGYGPGAANLDTEGGPTAFRLSRADGGRINTSELTGARTRNLTSGHDPKIVFQSIALGQETSVGTLEGAFSYTPSVRVCGVDLCAREYGAAGRLTPLADDVVEVSLRYALRRGSHEWAVSAGLAESRDATGRPDFEGITTLDAGLSWRHGDWRAGARWLRSDNGIAAGDRDYEAWSASGGYETGPWLWTVEYAAFSDDLVHVDGQTWQASGSRLVGERWLIGAGVQASERREPLLLGGVRTVAERDRTTGFVELGWQF